jgi:hypothetical protein
MTTKVTHAECCNETVKKSTYKLCKKYFICISKLKKKKYGEDVKLCGYRPYRRNLLVEIMYRNG